MTDIQTSDLIAIGAACIAGLSALYARWTVTEAKRANEIAIHNERLKIYKSLVDYRALLSAKGPRFSEEELWRFYEPVQLSEFYYGPNLHKEMLSIWDDSQTLLSLRASWEEAKAEGSSEHLDLNKKVYALHSKTRDYCDVVAENMKPILRIGKA